MASPDENCAACPFAGTPTLCHARRTRHAPLCDPKYRDFVLRRTAEDAGLPPPTPRPRAVVASRPPPVPASLPPLPRLPAAKSPPLILYLLNSCGIAGGVRVVYEHLNGLADRGHDVALVVADGSRPDPAWHPVRFPVESLAAAVAGGLWARADAIVATHWTTAAEVAANPARRRLYFVQGREDTFSVDEAVNAQARATYTLPGLRPLATSRWVRRFLEDEFGHRDVPVVPQGVDCDAWYPDPDPGPIARDGRFRVLITGHELCGSAKNVSDAYATCDELRRRGWDVEVWAFSQHPHDGYRPDRFWLAPDQATIRRLYSSADVLLISSRLEGRPLPFGEAMACGCPVVTMDCRGTDDLEGYGPITPVGDVPAMADAVAGLIRDPARRAATAAAALAHARRDLRWDAAIDALEAAFGLAPPPTRGSVAVALPTYARPEKIGRALDSLLSQTRSDWSCVVVVNGGKMDDAYRRGLAPYLADPRVAAIYTPEAGIPGALDAALARVDADYLAVLEDDDAWHPEFLARLATAMDRDPGCTLAYGDIEEYWDEDPPRPTVPRHTKPPDESGYAFRRDVLMSANWVCYPMQLHRVAALRAVGGFHADAGGCSDWDTALRLSGVGRVRHVRRTLARHYWHGDNTCADRDAMAPGAAFVRGTAAAGGYRPGEPTTAELIAGLTDGQRAVIASCSHHATVSSCCGSRDICRPYGRIRSNATRTEDCIKCVALGLPR